MKSKNILLIEDISCFGKCSTTVAFPILQFAGFEVSILPTAIFSTHTGISKDAVGIDFIDEMDKILKHWDKMGLTFDAILIGYTYREAQVKRLIEYLIAAKPSIVVLDPAMADNGKLYSKLSENYPESIKSLCKYCDYITPNITEAFLLTGKPYHKGPYNKAEIMELLIILYGKFRKSFVITGIEFIENKLYVMGINNMGDVYSYETKRADKNYSGTGDAFASIFLRSLLKGEPFQNAIKTAMDLTTKAVFVSSAEKCNNLCFEEILKELVVSNSI